MCCAAGDLALIVGSRQFLWGGGAFHEKEDEEQEIRGGVNERGLDDDDHDDHDDFDLERDRWDGERERAFDREREYPPLLFSRCTDAICTRSGF